MIDRNNTFPDNWETTREIEQTLKVLIADSQLTHEEAEAISESFLLDRDEVISISQDSRSALYLVIFNDIRKYSEGIAKKNELSIQGIQSMLNDVPGISLTPDGDYWPKTFRAVSYFQKQNNLQEDGLLWPKTLWILKSHKARHSLPNTTDAPPSNLANKSEKVDNSQRNSRLDEPTKYAQGQGRYGPDLTRMFEADDTSNKFLRIKKDPISWTYVIGYGTDIGNNRQGSYNNASDVSSYLTNKWYSSQEIQEIYNGGHTITHDDAQWLFEMRYNNRVNILSKALTKAWYNLSVLPKPAQWILIDMSYNLKGWVGHKLGWNTWVLAHKNTIRTLFWW